MATLRTWIGAATVASQLWGGSASAATVDLAGDWTGTTAAGTGIEVTVTYHDPAGQLRGSIELLPREGFQYHAFTGALLDDTAILDAPDLRLVLTVADGRLTGRAERFGRPDVAVSLTRADDRRPSEAREPASVPVVRPTEGLPVLQVRCNARVIVYVDDRPIGYAPQDVPVSVGAHRVTVKIAGRPTSTRSRTVEVSSSTVVAFQIDPASP